jgi:UDP-perosamine 4-acetyltransferase
MEPILVIGGGGHAKVVLEIFEQAGLFEVIGCVTRGPSESRVLDVPVLGDDSSIPGLYSSGVRKAFVAIGDNRARRVLSKLARTSGFELVNAISPHAIISRRAELCSGIVIMPGVVLNSCSRIGEGCIVNTGATVDHDCVIEDWVHLAPGTTVAGNVCVREGAFLGVGAKVIPKISIGAWTIVGAGSVVIRDLPSGVTAVGAPARIII